MNSGKRCSKATLAWKFYAFLYIFSNMMTSYYYSIQFLSSSGANEEAFFFYTVIVAACGSGDKSLLLALICEFLW